MFDVIETLFCNMAKSFKSYMTFSHGHVFKVLIKDIISNPISYNDEFDEII